MAIKTIIFDFGNVIGFFDPWRAVRQVAAATGVPEQQLHGPLLDARLEDDYESGRITSADFLHRLRTTCRLTLPDDVLGELYSDIFWPNPEVCALVPRLRGRYRLLLGSNTTELHARRFRREFADVLAYLDELVLSYEIGARKPKAAFFEHCQRLAACAPQECLFIDDLEANVAGAQACGLQGIVYRRDTNLREQLLQRGVTVDGEQGLT